MHGWRFCILAVLDLSSHFVIDLLVARAMIPVPGSHFNYFPFFLYLILTTLYRKWHRKKMPEVENRTREF